MRLYSTCVVGQNYPMLVYSLVKRLSTLIQTTDKKSKLNVQMVLNTIILFGHPG